MSGRLVVDWRLRHYLVSPLIRQLKVVAPRDWYLSVISESASTLSGMR